MISNRNAMVNFSSARLLIGNPYPWYGLAMAAASVALCVIYARRKALRESFDFYSKDHDYPADVKLITGKMRLEGSAEEVKRALRRNRVANAAVNVVMSAVILAMLAFNVLVLGMSLISPDDETSPVGLIPYVFQSNMMEPEIMFNDLAIFETVDPVSPLEKGEVVLFKYGGEPYVARIVDMDGDVIKTDIDYYPSTTKEEAYARNTTRGAIYARLAGTNRWIGAIVLFANTTIGRLMMLLVPCVLIFFYKPIIGFLSRLSGGTEKEKVKR
jgi:signal peptidase I